MEKQTYALIKALEDFRFYILHSHSYILTQSDPQGRREKWIAIMLEYDLEIKPTKLIKV